MLRVAGLSPVFRSQEEENRKVFLFFYLAVCIYLHSFGRIHPSSIGAISEKEKKLYAVDGDTEDAIYVYDLPTP